VEPLRICAWLPSVLKPATQVAALQCPANATAFWNNLAEQAQCSCNPGYRFNLTQTACLIDPTEQVAATKCHPNAQVYWNEELSKVRCKCIEGHVWNEEKDCGECMCKKGYRWNEQRDACVADARAQVAAMNCKGAYPNSETYWDAAQQVARRRCVTGFRWNNAQQACIADMRDAAMDALLGKVEDNRTQAYATSRSENDGSGAARKGRIYRQRPFA